MLASALDAENFGHSRVKLAGPKPPFKRTESSGKRAGDLLQENAYSEAPDRDLERAIGIEQAARTPLQPGCEAGNDGDQAGEPERPGSPATQPRVRLEDHTQAAGGDLVEPRRLCHEAAGERHEGEDAAPPSPPKPDPRGERHRDRSDRPRCHGARGERADQGTASAGRSALRMSFAVLSALRKASFRAMHVFA